MNKQKKTFKDFNEEKARKQALGRLQRLSPFWFAAAIVFVICVGMAAYFAAKFYFAKEAQREALQKRKFTSYYAEITIEDEPGKKNKDLFFYEKAVAFLDTRAKLFGYRFPTPTVYVSPEGSSVNISYDLKGAKINGRDVAPKLITQKKSKIGAIAIRGEKVPLKWGENVFEVDYRVSDIPLQDKFGQESLRWNFPRSRLSLVDKVEVVIVLPQYAEKDKVDLTSKIIIPGSDSEREAPQVEFGESFLKGKIYTTATFKASNLDMYEVLTISLKW